MWLYGPDGPAAFYPDHPVPADLWEAPKKADSSTPLARGRARAEGERTEKPIHKRKRAARG